MESSWDYWIGIKNSFGRIYDLIAEQNSKPFTVILYNLKNIGFENQAKDIFYFLSLDVNEDNDDALRKMGFPKTFMMVLRPDNYIGSISAHFNSATIYDFMISNYSLNRS